MRPFDNKPGQPSKRVGSTTPGNLAVAQFLSLSAQYLNLPAEGLTQLKHSQRKINNPRGNHD